MRFPAGTDGGSISSPQDEEAVRQLMSVTGAIEIATRSGHGFILTEKGTLLAAYFRSDEGVFRGKPALSHMALDSGETDEQTFGLRIYTNEEFIQAVQIAHEENLLISGRDPAHQISGSPPPSSLEKNRPPGAPASRQLDEARLRKILGQPGVIAVSAFFEGFPVQSVGDGDFEHVAALAEDFLRSGTKIAREMGIGVPDQLILETNGNKCIIAPCGDLALCILTKADAQLGLIRVVLKSIQDEIRG
jgi:predicted regulator of Ras-like GTPase activity (Roadblock/LC7/MglB family)